jgi:ABC-type multidrug transport system permease subunit
MKARHVWAIARKEWLHIIRDPLSVFLLGIGPVLMLILVSYAMAADVKNVPTVILDQDGSPQAAALIEQLDATQTLHVTSSVPDEQAANDKLERREAKLVAIIEPGFGAQTQDVDALASTDAQAFQPHLRFIIDGTDPVSAETAIEAALNESERFITAQMNAALDARLAAGGDPARIAALRQQLQVPIDTTVENRYNPNLKAIWSLVPALIAVVLTLPGMSISTVIARERTLGTFEGLVATPIHKQAILLGKAIPYMALALVNVALMLVVARVVFGVPFRGSLILYLALSGLYAFATLAVGMLFSILIHNSEAALWASMLFFLFPGMLLSGMFFPVEVFPFVVRIETLELPVVSGVIINRGMFLQGTGLRELWWNILLLLIIAVEGFEIAGRLFKKRIA